MVWVDTDANSGVCRDGILERHFSRDFWAKIRVFSDFAEMEFLDGILVEISGQKFELSQTSQRWNS